MSNRVQGTVKWFSRDKGYGFIICDDGEELFVHLRAIREQPNGYRRPLFEGQRVEFSVETAEKGPQAQDVEAFGKPPKSRRASNKKKPTGFFKQLLQKIFG